MAKQSGQNQRSKTSACGGCANGSTKGCSSRKSNASNTQNCNS